MKKKIKNINNIFKYLLIVGIITIGVLGVAEAVTSNLTNQLPPGHPGPQYFNYYHRCCCGCACCNVNYNTQTTTQTNVNSKAWKILNSSKIVTVKNCWGYSRYLIENNGYIVGVLWQNVSIKKLEIGQPFEMPWFIKVPLIYNGQIVGFLKIPK